MFYTFISFQKASQPDLLMKAQKPMCQKAMKDLLNSGKTSTWIYWRNIQQCWKITRNDLLLLPHQSPLKQQQHHYPNANSAVCDIENGGEQWFYFTPQERKPIRKMNVLGDVYHVHYIAHQPRRVAFSTPMRYVMVGYKIAVGLIIYGSLIKNDPVEYTV